MRRLACLWGVLLAASACGGGRTDVRTRSGPTVFAGTTSYFALRTVTVEGPGGEPMNAKVFILEILESPDGCGPRPGVSPYPGAVLSVWLYAPEGDSIRPGTFQITRSTSGSGGWAGYSKFPMVLSAVSGEFELGRLAAEAAQGTVDVTLQDGTRLDGEFSAAPCPVPALAGQR